MSATSTTLLSPRQQAKQTGQTYFFHTTDFARGRRLAEPIQEEDEMSDAAASEILSAEGSDSGEYDSDETETPNYRNGNGHANGNGNGNGNGQHYSGTAESMRHEDVAEYPSSAAQPKLSSWADLDLSVIIALVSPIGQWLTGGDHIKNLFLMVLLVFYLHQLIQVPWELYRASLPRRAAAPLPRAKDAKSRLLRLAASELRTHEHMYLALTVLSPLLGALFLRYTLSALAGADHMSWFSTTLFVLATGTRPWSHLLARTTEVHDAIHYPGPESAFSAARRLEAALKRIDALEREVGAVSARAAAAPAAGVEEAYDDLSGGLEEVEKAVRRGQRKMEAARAAQDARLAALERNLAFLLEDRLQQRAHAIQYGPGIVAAVLAIPHGVWARPVLSEKQHDKQRLETIQEDPVDAPAPTPDARHSSSETALPVEFSMTPAPASFFGLALAVLTWPMRVFLAACRAFQRAFFPARQRRHHRHSSH
ncbi:hypothetical protein FIBSPDRAFT_935986 [Athelia psychrophila]|uniref:Uncharacterized protein n=1 Tax=Athelia psychrophila TaxID=1759441 RepID=A0A166CSY5_9AGAM|nr:hypothetical protein FIBSPDRAFT_935986 [Fibularhizoctonia sp. CBS 109695]